MARSRRKAQIFSSPWGLMGRQEMRALLGEAQNWRCCYCGCCLTDPPARGPAVMRPTDATIEHVERTVDGGRDDWFNAAVACFTCNSGRGESDALTFFRERPSLLRTRRAQARWLRRQARKGRHGDAPPARPRLVRHREQRWPPLLFDPGDGGWP